MQVYRTMLSTKNQWQLRFSLLWWWFLEASCDWQKYSLDNIGVPLLVSLPACNFPVFASQCKTSAFRYLHFCPSEAEIVLDDTTHYVETQELLKCSAKNFILHDGTMWVLNQALVSRDWNANIEQLPNWVLVLKWELKPPFFNSISLISLCSHTLVSSLKAVITKGLSKYF